MDFPIRLTDQLGPHIKSLRKARGLSQTTLGKRIGVGQARMAEIEAAPGLVNLEQLLKLFRALETDLVLRSEDASAYWERTLGFAKEDHARDRPPTAPPADAAPVTRESLRRAVAMLGLPSSSAEALYLELVRSPSAEHGSVLHRQANEGLW